MRIAFIGAGSVGFTQKLVRDILTVPELQETEFSLQDISQDNLEMVKQLLEKRISPQMNYQQRSCPPQIEQRH